MTKQFEFNWRIPVPEPLQAGGVFDCWDEVKLLDQYILTSVNLSSWCHFSFYNLNLGLCKIAKSMHLVSQMCVCVWACVCVCVCVCMCKFMIDLKPIALGFVKKLELSQSKGLKIWCPWFLLLLCFMNTQVTVQHLPHSLCLFLFLVTCTSSFIDHNHACQFSNNCGTLDGVIITRKKDCFSVFLSQHLCRLISACLAFLCTAHTKLVAHVKDPCSPFDKRRLMISAMKHTDKVLEEQSKWGLLLITY